VPSEWSVQDKESTQRIMDTGVKVVAGNDKNLKAVIKASEMQTVGLLAAFKHPLGTPVPFNPNIICMAERIRHMPGIKRGKDYHYHTKKLLSSSQVAVSFPKEISTEKLAGRDFDVLHTEITLTGVTVRQKHYAAIMKGYALLIAISFATEEEESALRDILSTATLK